MLGLTTRTQTQRRHRIFLFYHIRWATHSRDSFHFSKILQTCSSKSHLNQIHDQIIVAGLSQNMFLGSKLVSRYAESGDLGYARNVFDRTPDKDVFLWNIMIRSYTSSEAVTREAVDLYACMRHTYIAANCYTYTFVLKACAESGDRGGGRAVHAHAVRDELHTDLFVGNALVAFYAKCGQVMASKKVFDEIDAKDLVSWNSMIAGYIQNGHAREAILHLHHMLWDDGDNKPDYVSLVTVLVACTSLVAVHAGMWVHTYAVKSGMRLDAEIGSGLIGMYANCGHLGIARDIFDRISDKNIVVFYSMMRGYGMHGHPWQALEIFLEMLEMGIRPDGICFVSILSTCSHTGLVNKGWEMFDMMDKCGVKKDQVHYACMVDLLGRAGLLSDAVEFIRGMPVMPERDVWGALLGACRMHNDLELAEEAANRLFLLDPENAGRYAVLASMYLDAGRWTDAATMRKAMRDRSVRKPIGCSSVQLHNEVYTFGVEDESHSMTPSIFNVLKQLQKVMMDEEEEEELEAALME